MDTISKTVQGVKLSGIRKFSNKTSKYDDVISLTLGEPDFQVPLKIKEAIKKGIEEGKTRYTSNMGIEDLRIEISKYLMDNFNIKYDHDEICLTVGGSEGIFSLITTLINPGDKVIIPTPAYPAYEGCVKINGGEVINCPLNSEFEIDFEMLEHIIMTQRPKILILSYPCNPTGAILSKQDRDKLYELIKERDILVISDEIYSALCFDDKYYSLAQCDDIKDKVIIVSGFSKMFSMMGLRLGYVCGSKNIIENVVKVHAYNVSCAPSISQYGALEGLRHCMKDVEFMKNEFIKRRNYVYERLVNMGFDVKKPKGAFYIFPSIKKFNMKSEEFCDRLLREQNVALIPGSAFGIGGEGYVRISYSYSMKELEIALDRLEKFITS